MCTFRIRAELDLKQKRNMKHIDIEAEMVVPSGTGVQDLSGLQPKIDESLTTADKTVAGAINELNGAVGDINSTLDAINGEVI